MKYQETNQNIGGSAMKSTVRRTIDDFGRLLLPSDLRSIFGVVKGDKLTAAHNSETNALVLKKQEKEAKIKDFGVNLKIDDMGRISLPKSVRDQLGWLHIKEGDIINIRYSPDEGTVTLSAAGANDTKCVFCKNPELVSEINGIGVCSGCAKNLSSICQ